MLKGEKMRSTNFVTQAGFLGHSLLALRFKGTSEEK